MTSEQICSIGKVEINDENTKIIKSYQQYIIPWLNSDKFKDHWANKPYPPLIDPDKMEWGGSDALHAWTLICLCQNFMILWFLARTGLA